MDTAVHTDPAAYVRVDLDAHPSAAMKALNDNAPNLTSTIEQLESIAADRAAQMKRADLIDGVIVYLAHGATPAPEFPETGDEARLRSQLGKMTLAQLRDAYAQVGAGADSERAELAALREAGHADRMFAHWLNSRIRHAEDVHGDLEQAVKLGPKQASTFLRAKGDRYQRSQHAAQLASMFGRAVADGADLREYTERSLRVLLQQILRFPQDVHSNGLSGEAKAEEMHRAHAAEYILSDIRSSYGNLEANPITIDLGALRH